MTPQLILTLNAAATAACAIGMLAARSILPAVFGLDSPLLLDTIAIAFLAYAAVLVAAARRQPVERKTLLAFTDRRRAVGRVQRHRPGAVLEPVHRRRTRTGVRGGVRGGGVRDAAVSRRRRGKHGSTASCVTADHSSSERRPAGVRRSSATFRRERPAQDQLRGA